MNLIPKDKLSLFNQNLLHESPDEIIRFALDLSQKPLLTTSFGRFSEVIIHAVIAVDPKVKILWCDTGYNSEATYQHAYSLEAKYRLDLDVIAPEYTRAFTEYRWGAPALDNPNHHKLTDLLKVAPLKKAFGELKPDLWFTNIRKGQTSFRDQLDVLSLSPDGILKVSPFYHFSDEQMLDYCKKHNLQLNQDYFDPIKALSKRECGIHFSN